MCHTTPVSLHDVGNVHVSHSQNYYAEQDNDHPSSYQSTPCNLYKVQRLIVKFVRRKGTFVVMMAYIRTFKSI